MNDTNTQKIKNEDKKALPVFILVMLASAILGFVSYAAITYVAFLTEGSSAVSAFLHAFTVFLPYSILVLMAIFDLPCVFILHKAKKALAGWDGEEEATPDLVEISTSKVILLSNISYILSLFFFPLDIVLPKDMSRSDTGLGLLFFSFVLSLIVLVLLQRAAVNLQKKMNPEKQGSIFDLRFQKKWNDSCDEAERQRIGNAAYAAFKATMISCMVLWVVTLLLSTVTSIGIYGFLLLTIILLVSIITFCVTDIRAIQKKRK